ncbi:MAG: sigma-70 family RNA polymerase sigma factor [Luteimonas sp.]
MEYSVTMIEDPRLEFAALLDQHRKIVFKVAHAYATHPDDRADLAQEIAAQLWRAYRGYDPQRTFSTWMYRIALNVAISFLRNDVQRRGHAVALDDALHDAADDNAADPEIDGQVRALHRFIAQLDPLNRALLLLYLDDRPQREIAEVLGISETNVSTKIGRLKQRIRNDLA